MHAPNLPIKAAVSVLEMAELCEISRSRWYELVDAGVFPAPVVLLPIKRPVYDRAMIEKCLQIKQTGPEAQEDLADEAPDQAACEGTADRPAHRGDPGCSQDAGPDDYGPGRA